MKKLLLALIAVAVALAISPAAKADTVYTTSAAFAAATSTVDMVSVTFPSPGSSPGYTSDPSYYDVDGITITSAASTIHTNDAGYYAANGGSASPTNYVVLFGQTTDTATIAFQPGYSAFSIYLGGGSNPAGETGTVTLSDSFVYDFTAPAYVSSGAPLDFFGFISTTPISSAVVTFNGPDDASTEYGVIGDISYAGPRARRSVPARHRPPRLGLRSLPQNEVVLAHSCTRS